MILPTVKAAFALVTKLVAGSQSRLSVDVDGNLFARTTDEPFRGSRPVDLTGDTSFAAPPRAVYVGGAGTLKVDCYDLDGTTTLTGKNIPVTDFQMLSFGSILKIYSTVNGTTATGLWVGT